jgi:iron-sulfur cluster repair protein YtfE (RIC family)
METPNPLAWREAAAVADMHVRIAAKKLNAVIQKDLPDIDKMISEFGKAIECIEAAHEAAMRAHTQLTIQARRRQSVRGVRLTSLRQPAGPLKIAIGDSSQLGKPEKQP